MKPFENFTSVVAILAHDNIDTDAIIPSREIQSPEKTGYGKKLFSGWRYVDSLHTENTEFILNKEPYRHASILLSGENFGCGSSREMAVWALQQYGFKVLIAKSFGSIFKNNCNKNGLLTITISHQTYEILTEEGSKRPLHLNINLPEQFFLITNQKEQFVERFEIDHDTKQFLLTGEDEISKTLKYLAEIEEFCERDRSNRPWIWGDEKMVQK